MIRNRMGIASLGVLIVLFVACGSGGAIDLSGKYLYATSGYPGSSVSQYTIGANGTLTPMAQPTVPSGSGPNAIVIVKK